MKATATQSTPPKTFQPVTLTLTLESQDEVDKLYAIMDNVPVIASPEFESSAGRIRDSLGKFVSSRSYFWGTNITDGIRKHFTPRPVVTYYPY